MFSHLFPSCLCHIHRICTFTSKVEVLCIPRCVRPGTRIGAEYSVDLRLKTDFSQAAETDELEGTVNYGEVFQAVKAEMMTPSKLLEHVAGRIAQRLLHDFPTVEEVRIAVYKQNPPMGADCQQTGVEATYQRKS
mgnify:CR=1 FL=1